MALSRKHKILLAVVGMGALALVLDRTVLGKPQSAEAAVETAAPGDAADTASTQAAEALAASQSGQALANLSDFAQRLAQNEHAQETSGSLRDAFAPPESWPQRVEIGEMADQPQVSEKQLSDLGKALMNNYEIEGIVDSGGIRNRLIIGGKIVEIGGVFEGFILIAIRERVAVWQSTEEADERLLMRISADE